MVLRSSFAEGQDSGNEACRKGGCVLLPRRVSHVVVTLTRRARSPVECGGDLACCKVSEASSFSCVLAGLERTSSLDTDFLLPARRPTMKHLLQIPLFVVCSSPCCRPHFRFCSSAGLSDDFSSISRDPCRKALECTRVYCSGLNDRTSHLGVFHSSSSTCRRRSRGLAGCNCVGFAKDGDREVWVQVAFLPFLSRHDTKGGVARRTVLVSGHSKRAIFSPLP